MTTLKNLIDQQEKFVKQEQFVLEVLKFHKNRQDKPFTKIQKFKVNRKNDLLCVISHKLQEKYELQKYINNADYLWECLEELAYDIMNGYYDQKIKKWQYIGLKSNGIFSYLDIVPKKNKLNIIEATEFFVQRFEYID